MKTHYETLGVAQSATTQEIKQAYRQLCLQTHPDLAGPASVDLFKAISHAHQILINPKERRSYDLELSYQSNWSSTRSSSGGGGTSRNGRHRYPHDFREHLYRHAHTADFAQRRARASSSWSSSFDRAKMEFMFGQRFSSPYIVTVGLGIVAVWWSVTLLWGTDKRPIPESARFQPHKIGPRRRNGGGEVVEAWKNPKTGLWEQPAPWDPTYRRLQPKLELVPRHQVRQRSL